MDFIIANVRIFAMVCVALFVAQSLSDYTFKFSHAFIAYGVIALSIFIFAFIVVVCDAVFFNKK